MDQEILTYLLQQVPTIGVLGVVCYKLWGAYQDERNYAKAQDKLIVDVLNSTSNLLSKISENEKDQTEMIEEIKDALSETKMLVDVRTTEVINLYKAK
jgi:hypothetical protein